MNPRLKNKMVSRGQFSHGEIRIHLTRYNLDQKINLRVFNSKNMELDFVDIGLFVDKDLLSEGNEK